MNTEKFFIIPESDLILLGKLIESAQERRDIERACDLLMAKIDLIKEM